MLSLFKNLKAKKKNSHLSNLIAVSKLDGSLHKEEMEYLYKVGARYGYSASDIDSFVNEKTTVDAYIPQSRDERVELTLDLLEMISSDKVITEEELDFVTNYAIKLGFKVEIAGILVRKMAMELVNDKSRAEVKEAILPFLVY